jgi:hypothetical protein
MPLDFTRAAALFMGTEEELAKALGITIADVRAGRQVPGQVPHSLLVKLGHVLIERGAGMKRVGEMLAEGDGTRPGSRRP